MRLAIRVAFAALVSVQERASSESMWVEQAQPGWW
jgi:hypothetical protein